MRSMTGFGAGSANLAQGRIHLEIRALNHKSQDVRLRVPQELAEHGSFLEQAARAQLGRGRFDIQVRVEGDTGGEPQVDAKKLRALYRSLAALQDELAPGTQVSLASLVAIPNMLTTNASDPEKVRLVLISAFEKAEAALLTMREAEGAALKLDLLQRLARSRALRAELENGTAELIVLHRERLQERLKKLLEGAPSSGINHDRLEQEVAILADRSDITEELVRLDSHFSQFEGLLESDEPVGRRLDFLLQEISREVNTVGSKSQHAKVAHLVVEMKSEVERIREQVQNVE